MDNALVASRGRTRAVTPVGFEVASRLLARADVWIDGPRPWDIQVRHPNTLARILKYGSLGLGESYVDGWWDCAQLDALVARVLAAKLDEAVVQPGFLWSVLRARLFNLQSTTRAWHVGRAHYDLGNDHIDGVRPEPQWPFPVSEFAEHDYQCTRLYCDHRRQWPARPRG